MQQLTPYDSGYCETFRISFSAILGFHQKICQIKVLIYSELMEVFLNEFGVWDQPVMNKSLSLQTNRACEVVRDLWKEYGLLSLTAENVFPDLLL